MSWQFLEQRDFVASIIIATYVAGAQHVLRKRVKGAISSNGNINMRRISPSGCFFVAVCESLLVVIVGSLWISFSFLAAATALVIIYLGQFPLAALKRIFYPFLD